MKTNNNKIKLIKNQPNNNKPNMKSKNLTNQQQKI